MFIRRDLYWLSGFPTAQEHWNTATREPAASWRPSDGALLM